VVHWNRALTTLAAVVAAGLLFWFAPHFNRWSAGGYWGLVGVMALAGVLIGLAQLRGRGGNPPASFLTVFMPVLVCAGWVIVAAEPHGSWLRNHVLSWSGDMGIAHAVHNLAEHVTVLAFGLGIVFGLTFEPAMLRRGATSALPASSAPAAGPPLPPDPAPKEASPGQPDSSAAAEEPSPGETAASTAETESPREAPSAPAGEPGEQGPATPTGS
jgi:hypothetical protein